MPEIKALQQSINVVLNQSNGHTQILNLIFLILGGSVPFVCVRGRGVGEESVCEGRHTAGGLQGEQPLVN